MAAVDLPNCGAVGAGVIELFLPSGERARAFLPVLSERLALVDRDGARADRIDRTYLDTFDGRLHRRGWRLYVYRDRAGDMATLIDGNGGVFTGSPAPALSSSLFASALPAGEVRDRVERVTEPRALQPLARVRTARHEYNVVNADRKTVARIALVEPAVMVSRRGSTQALRPRVELREVRGYGGAFARTERVLAGDLGLVRAEVDVFEEAMIALGRPAGGISSALDMRLDPSAAAGHAVVTVLARLLVIMESNVPGVLDDTDSEFLHDLRVAVRRSRSLVKQMAGVIPEAVAGHLRTELQWLQHVTGPTRDLDVHIVDLADERARLPKLPASHLEPVGATLAARRSHEFRKLVRALRSDRFTTFLADGNALVVSGFGPDAGPLARHSIADVASGRVATLYKRMVKRGSAITDNTPDEALHDLRKQGKELRYLVEMFGSALPVPVLESLVPTLKALQDRLGEFNDRHVQATFLWQVSHEMPPDEGWGPALMAAGVIVERLHREQAAARAHFPERFARFASKDNRRMVRDLLG